MADTGASALQSQAVTVLGEGRVIAAPNMMVLAINVESRGSNATEAQVEAANRSARIVHALVAKGIQQADIETTWVGAYPLYAQAGQQQPAGVAAYPFPAPAGQFPMPYLNTLAPPGLPPVYTQLGQTAANPMPAAALFVAGTYLRVTLRELNRLGEMLDAANAAGATSSMGKAMGLQDEAAARHTALQAAAQDARMKATALAEITGRHLGAAVAIEEVPLPGWGLDQLTSALNTQPALSPLGGLPGSMTTPHGELVYRAYVRVTFALA